MVAGDTKIWNKLLKSTAVFVLLGIKWWELSHFVYGISCLLNSTISRLISVSDTHRNRCRLSITTLVSWKSGEWLTLNFFKAHQPYRVLASMTTFQVLLRYDGFYHGKLIVRHSLARLRVYCVTYQLQEPGTSNHHLKSCKINVGASTSKFYPHFLQDFERCICWGHLEHSVKMSAKLFSELKLVTDNLLSIYAAANWEATESLSSRTLWK